MGRTDQVLTGGFLSFHPFTTTMKAVLALLIVCLIQISFAEQENVADDASSVANLLLQREVREAGKGGCEPGDKKCRRKRLRQQKKKSKKNRRKGKLSQKGKKGKKGGKEGGKGNRKKLTRRKKQKTAK